MLPELAGDTSSTVCIVIDVLRATTVVATLFERGCPQVFAAANHDSARKFARSNGYILCGETGGLKVPDFDYGNSPVEFSTLDFTNQPAVVSTTNGTRAISMVGNARCVLLGCARNRMAVAREAWKEATSNSSDIVVVCSGTDRQFTLEDATVAGMFIEAIVGMAGTWDMPQLADSAIASRRLWQYEPYLLRGWMEGRHAQRLGDYGFGEDLGYCSQIDCSEVVPVLVNEADAAGVSAPVLLVLQ